MRNWKVALAATATLFCAGCATDSERADNAAKTTVDAAIYTGAFVGTMIAQENCDQVKPDTAREDCIRRVNNADQVPRAQQAQREKGQLEDYESYRKRKDAELGEAK